MRSRARSRLLDALEQGVGGGAGVDHGASSCRRGARSSSARFSSRTLTTGSPRTPNWRGSMRLVGQLAHGGLGEAALARDAGDLEQGGGRADVRIETGSRAGHQVDRDGHARIVLLEARHVGGHPVDQLLVGRPEVRARRGARVVARASGRGPRVEVARRGERLADDARPDDLPIALDQLAVSLVGEQDLGEAGHHERIDKPEQYGRDHRHQERGLQMVGHGEVLRSWGLEVLRS